MPRLSAWQQETIQFLVGEHSNKKAALARGTPCLRRKAGKNSSGKILETQTAYMAA